MLPEYNRCVEILTYKPTWFFQSDNLQQKLDCLERFRVDGNPNNIRLLQQFLVHQDKYFRDATAQVVIELFGKLKSQNELYGTLKPVGISANNIERYRELFNADIAVTLIAIASFNYDGRVREKATKALGDVQHPYAIRYLCIRHGDWVKEVRAAAEKALQSYINSGFVTAFIEQFESIDQLQRIERVDLSKQYAAIVGHVTSIALSNKIYSGITNRKSKQLYLRAYFRAKEFTDEHAYLLLNDKSFSLRIELLKFVPPDRSNDVISKLLHDSSASVRLRTLYFIKDQIPVFEKDLYPLISDHSAAVRDFVRYYLKYKSIDFPELYRQRIRDGESIVGSLAGLSETGSVDDVALFSSFLSSESTSIKIVCLFGLKRFDPDEARRQSLLYILADSSKVRNAAAIILYASWDSDVREQLHELYQRAGRLQKSSILKLFSHVGGWDSIVIIIEALSDSDHVIQSLAWDFLHRWYQQAFRLFTTPPPHIMAEAIRKYEAIGLSAIKGDEQRLKILKEIEFYLRR